MVVRERVSQENQNPGEEYWNELVDMIKAALQEDFDKLREGQSDVVGVLNKQTENLVMINTSLKSIGTELVQIRKAMAILSEKSKK